MVTGDNVQTAKAIALECGILSDADAREPILIEGKAFRAYSETEREDIAERITVCQVLSFSHASSCKLLLLLIYIFGCF